MSTKQNFNDILRSKFIDRELPVDEENWKNMRAMINESRKRKRRMIWYLSSLGLLLCGVGAYFLVQLPESKKAATPVSSSIQSLAENKATPTNTANTSQQIGTTQPAKETTTSTTKENTTSNNASANNTIVSNEPAKKAVNTANTHTTSPAEIVNTVSVATPKHSNKSVKNTVEDRTVATTSSLSKKQHTDSTSDIKQVENTDVQVQMTSEKSNRKRETTSVKVDSVKPLTTVADNNATTNISATTTAKKGVTTNPAKVDSVVIAAVTKKDSAHKKADSIKPTLPQQPASLLLLGEKTMKKNNLSIDAGAGYSLSWKYGDTSEGRSINPLIGIGYTHAFDSSWAVKVGIQFSASGGMNATPYNITHTTYDFGLNSNDTSVTTKWLYYITFPFQLEYKLSRNDAIGLGGSISYLLNGSGTVTVSNVSGNVSSGAPNQYSQYLYVKGYNHWNASAFLLYKRTLFRNLSAYLVPYFGLIDIKSNSFFMRTTFERDSGVKLILSYTIL